MTKKYNYFIALLLLPITYTSLYTSADLQPTKFQTIKGKVFILHDHTPYYRGIPNKILVDKLKYIVDEKGKPILFGPETPMITVQALNYPHKEFEEDEKLSREKNSEIRKLMKSNEWNDAHPLYQARQRMRWAQTAWHDEHPVFGKGFPNDLPISLLDKKGKITFNFVAPHLELVDEEENPKIYTIVLEGIGFNGLNFQQSLQRVKEKFAKTQSLATAND